MRRFLFILIMASLLAMPACAVKYNYTAPDDQAIWAVDMSFPPETTGTIILKQSNGDLTAGTISYTGFPTTYANIALQGDTSSGSYFVTGSMIDLKVSVWNGENSTYSRKLQMGYGQVSRIWNDVVSADIEQYPITEIFLDTSQEIEIDVEYIAYTEAMKNLTRDDSTDWLSAILEYGTAVKDIFFALMFWAKFLFVENLVMVVSLYLTGTMAYAMHTSKNIFVFYKTWFKQQGQLWHFIATLFSTIIGIVGQIVQMLKPI